MVKIILTAYIVLLVCFGFMKNIRSQRCDNANYTLINEPRRSTMAIFDSAVDVPICDEGLNEDRWVRYDSQAGNTLSERAENDSVPINRCGTQAPIYIRGLDSHPTVDSATANATVCANYGQNTCNWMESIQIHKCPAQGSDDSYFIYKLKSPPGCALAYCAGEGVPCNRGDYWNGFTCVNYFPPMTGFPSLVGPYTNGSGYTTEVYFTCTVQYTPSVNDTNARFRVTFLFDGLPLENVNGTKINARLTPFILTADDSMTVALGEYYLRGRLGREISCKAESYWKEYEPTANSTMFSQQNFYAAIQSESSSYILSPSSGSTFTINFRSTIPLTCRHCTEDYASCCLYRFRMQTEVASSSCYLLWTTLNSYTATASVYILPGQSQSKPFYALQFTPYNGDEVYVSNTGSLWRDYVLPSVMFEAITSTATYKRCDSVSDPYISTFDGRSYYLSELGDFYLLAAKTANQEMEIQVRVETCSYYPYTCNCGVIVREGNSVYKISMCENGPPDTHRTPTVVRLLSQDPMDSSTVYRDGTGTTFSVRMPSGLRVEIYSSTFLKIYAYIPPEYHGKTSSSSLCGNSNGNSGDDNAAGFQNVRVPDAANYFKTQPQCSSIFNPSAKSCECDSKPSNGIDFKCSNTDPLLRTVSRAQDPLADRWTSGVVCREQGVFALTTSLDEPSDFILDPAILYPPYSYDPNYGVNVSYTWPTKTGKTELQVEKYCAAMFNSSAAYSDCSESVNVTNLINMCISDIQRLDEWVPAAPYVEVLEEICINTLAAGINSSDIDDNSTYSSLISVRYKMCPSQCNNRGNCVEGSCICNQGYVGADCGIEEGVPPTLTGITRGDVCDSRSRPCEVISVFGTGVVPSATLKCRFYDSITDQYSETNGTFITGSEYSCPVSTTTSHRRRRRSTDTHITARSALDVSVTTDGLKYSNSIRFTVYDSKCLECNDSSNCKQKTDTCLIQNECIANDAVNANDPCLKCVPSINSNSWANIATQENWQQCSRQCDYGAQTRNTVCVTTVTNSEVQLCKSSDCTGNPEQRTQGVGVDLSQKDLAKILIVSSETLSRFADAMNNYCAKNPGVCCKSIGKPLHTGVNSVTFTSSNLLSYASGYPVLRANDASVKIIVRIDLPSVENQCAGTSTQSSKLVYADQQLIYDVVLSEKQKLEQELSVTLTDVWKLPSNNASAPALNVSSTLFILMLTLFCSIFCN